MSAPLLATKLFVPLARPELVPRPHLIERLNDGLWQGERFARKLTLVSAAAGFGKTTLVSEWVGVLSPGPSADRREKGRTEAGVAWLSLDEGDNDPARFTAYLLAALGGIDAAIAETAQAMLGSPQPPPPEALLTALINGMAGAHRPFLLVLDDYQQIHTLAIHQQLAFLLEHLPPLAHLVIATREDPPLPLSRLRARGQMAEIRQADLRFTANEAARFLRQVAQIELPGDQVDRLQQRTEGWIAGLQLLALSLRGRDDAVQAIDSFASSERYVLDYLMEEVFERQPPEVQDFLLKTSVLERMAAPLCDAVVGSPHPHARALLDQLDRAGLFVVSLDGERQWYRYHHLFSDLLRHRLETEQSFDAVELHRRAGQWYAANGHASDAVHHALLASDWDAAAAILTSGTAGALLSQGQALTLLDWCRAIPDAAKAADPSLGLTCAWPFILTDRLDQAEPLLDQAEAVAEARNDLPLLGQIAAARVNVARMRGDHRRAMELAEQALAWLPAGDHGTRSIVALNLGLARWFRGQLIEAEQALIEAERSGRLSANHYARFTAQVFLARALAARGRLREAAAHIRQTLAEGGSIPSLSSAHFDYGRILLEWNDLGAADDEVRQGVELSERSGTQEFLASGLATLAYVQQACGQATAALQSLQRAEAVGVQVDISPGTRLGLLSSRIRVALGQGRMGDAAEAVTKIPPAEQSGSLPDFLALAVLQTRLLLARGEQQAAARMAAAVHDQARAAGWIHFAIQARALGAVAAASAADRHALLAEALMLAEPGGYVRTFLDLGPPMGSALSEFLTACQARAHREPRAAGKSWPAEVGEAISPPPSHVCGYAARLLASFPGTPAPASATPPPGRDLPEPLSDREIEVLRLLAEGLTGHEIARSLVVSVNTIKTHLKNIYGKLGVNSRREAVARAHELHLPLSKRRA